MSLSHTHTHTLRTFNHGLQPWTWDLRNFTKREHTLQSFHGLTWTFCVCVWTFNYLTMDYLLPLPKSIIGHFFLYACLCDLLPNGGSLTIVDVHSWCVSTVIQQFYWNCPWLKVLTNAHSHTPLPERTGTRHSLVPLKYIMQISNTWLFWILLPLWLLRANSELL